MIGELSLHGEMGTMKSFICNVVSRAVEVVKALEAEMLSVESTHSRIKNVTILSAFLSNDLTSCLLLSSGVNEF